MKLMLLMLLLATVLCAGCVTLFQDHPDWPRMEPSPDMMQPYDW